MKAMDTSKNSKRAPAIVFVGLALLPLAYVGSYFALESLPSAIRLPQWLSARHTEIHAKYVEINGEWNRYPDYRGLPEWLFAPIHNYDRTHLRPGSWSGTHPRNRELSFDWLLGQTSSTATPTPK
jgi:hypothetical protein